jgi:hypothetical protein
VGGGTVSSLEEALRIRDMKVRQVGEDILVEGYLER